MTYTAGDTTRDGWSTGRLSVPTAAGPLVYETRYRVGPGGQTEVEVHPEGAPEDAIRAVVPDPDLPGGVDPEGWLVGALVVILMAKECAEAAKEAIVNCVNGALANCAATGLDHFKADGGYCGWGATCEFSCKK